MATVASAPSVHVDTLPSAAERLLAVRQSQPLGLVGFLVILLYVVFALGARWISPFDPEAIDFAAMLRGPARSTGSAPISTGATSSRASSTARARRWPSASCPPARLHVRRAGRRGIGLFRRPHRQRHPARGRRHAVVSDHRAGAWWWWRCSASATACGVDFNLIVAIALPMMPKMARVAGPRRCRSCAMPFIDAARAAGFSHTRIVLRHILPNIVAPYLIMVTAFIAQAILLEASLSFLGLGVTEPTPAWGLMLSGSVRRLLPDRAVDDHLPRRRHHARRVRLQPVRRQPARLARSEVEELIGHPARGGERAIWLQVRAAPCPVPARRRRARRAAYTPSALRTSKTSMMRQPLCGPSHTNCQRPSE